MLLGNSPTDPAVIDDRMVRTNQKVIGFLSSPLTSLFTHQRPTHMFRHGCAPPSGAGADLLLSYAAFISLAGGSCNKPLSTLPFSYVFRKASRLSRSGPSSTQSDLLLCPL